MGAIRRRLTVIMASVFTFVAIVAIVATAASAGQPPVPPIPLP